jgi:hypothetical protein
MCSQVIHTTPPKKVTEHCACVTVRTPKVLLTMKEISLKQMTIIQCGQAWPHPVHPTQRAMLPLLERKEQLVSWLQPTDGGVEDQVPSLRINNRFYSISLRLQKALFRHVRLQADFLNRERTPDGREKLRIPVSLLRDKRRTAARFSARANPPSATLAPDPTPKPTRRLEVNHSTPPYFRHPP